MVAALTSCDHVHPIVLAFEGIRNDVFARQFFFMKMAAAVSADVAVAYEEFAVGEAWAQVERVDAGHALGADDGADVNDALLARDRVMPAMERGHTFAHFPAHLIRGVMDDCLLQADPALRQPLS